MDKSYTAGWVSDSPTPAQLKEFQAQLDPKRKNYITGQRLQAFLRGQLVSSNDRAPEQYNPFFANLKVKSDRKYPDGFDGPKPVCEQLVLLSKHERFAKLDINSCPRDLPFQVPREAEGVYVIPPWQKVADSYNHATEYVINELERSRTLHNWQKGQLGEKYLRWAHRSAEGFRILGETQKTNFLLVPAQYGILHAGEAVLYVRNDYLKHEFGFGPYETGVILLSHPERLQGQANELYFDCPGGEYTYTPAADGDFTHAPCFYWHDGKLHFHTLSVGYPFVSFGSVSGFLPQ